MYDLLSDHVQVIDLTILVMGVIGGMWLGGAGVVIWWLNPGLVRSIWRLPRHH